MLVERIDTRLPNKLCGLDSFHCKSFRAREHFTSNCVANMRIASLSLNKISHHPFFLV